MRNAKRMILIEYPRTEAGYLNPLPSVLFNLDSKLLDVLARRNLKARDKWRLYNSTLQRYLNFLHLKRAELHKKSQVDNNRPLPHREENAIREVSPEWDSFVQYHEEQPDEDESIYFTPTRPIRGNPFLPVITEENKQNLSTPQIDSGFVQSIDQPTAHGIRRRSDSPQPSTSKAALQEIALRSAASKLKRQQEISPKVASSKVARQQEISPQPSILNYNASFSDPHSLYPTFKPPARSTSFLPRRSSLPLHLSESSSDDMSYTDAEHALSLLPEHDDDLESDKEIDKAIVEQMDEETSQLPILRRKRNSDQTQRLKEIARSANTNVNKKTIKAKNSKKVQKVKGIYHSPRFILSRRLRRRKTPIVPRILNENSPILIEDTPPSNRSLDSRLHTIVEHNIRKRKREGIDALALDHPKKRSKYIPGSRYTKHEFEVDIDNMSRRPKKRDKKWQRVHLE